MPQIGVQEMLPWASVWVSVQVQPSISFYKGSGFPTSHFNKQLSHELKDCIWNGVTWDPGLREASSSWKLDLVSDPQPGQRKCSTLFYR